MKAQCLLKMTSKNCKACGSLLVIEQLLVQKNSPSSAQGFSHKRNRLSNLDLKLVECNSCGVVQHINKHVEYYRDCIRAVSFSNEMKKFRLGFFERWIKKNNLFSKKFIEIGSSSGDYLGILKSLKYINVFGMENSTENIKKIKKLGISSSLITKGYLDKNLKNINGAPFDAFGIFSFLEHMPNPRESLSILKKYLQPNACGIIEVPNFDLIYQKKLFTEFTIDHIFYFNKKTFRNFLINNGFIVKKITPIWFDYILSAEVINKSSLNLKIFDNKLIQLRSRLEKFFNKSQKNIFVWGAGHQSLSVISLCNIEKHLSGIIDSATFKQNKYAPGTNLMVFSPKVLQELNANTVLIIAAGYSDEIASELLSKYKFISKIAILREDHIEILK